MEGKGKRKRVALKLAFLVFSGVLFIIECYVGR